MKIYLTLIFMVFGQLVSGQMTTQKLFELNDFIIKKHPENYRIIIKEFDKLPVDSMDARTKSLFYQLQSTYHSFIGNYDSSRFYWDQQYIHMLNQNDLKYDSTFYKQHSFVDAQTFILDRARNEKVVMINEAHNIPYHRAFVTQLLNGFRKLGFKYLAIEDLADENMNTTRVVTDTTGYYIREPLFAEMIREALRQNFVLIKYEADRNTNNNRMRDSLQAVNLVKLFHADPQAKLLVYAGYDHIHENTRTSWKKMAQFFKEMSNIDPLTISQTRHIERYYTEFETDEFQTVNKFVSFNAPIIALKDQTVWHDDFVDISLFYPRYLAQDNRPKYLTVNKDKKAVPLDTHGQEGLFVQAYYADEKQGHRVPADQLFIKNTKEFIYLRPGNYILEFKNMNDQIVNTKRVSVHK